MSTAAQVVNDSFGARKESIQQQEHRQQQQPSSSLYDSKWGSQIITDIQEMLVELDRVKEAVTAHAPSSRLALEAPNASASQKYRQQQQLLLNSALSLVSRPSISEAAGSEEQQHTAIPNAQRQREFSIISAVSRSESAPGLPTPISADLPGTPSPAFSPGNLRAGGGTVNGGMNPPAEIVSSGVGAPAGGHGGDPQDPLMAPPPLMTSVPTDTDADLGNTARILPSLQELPDIVDSIAKRLTAALKFAQNQHDFRVQFGGLPSTAGIEGGENLLTSFVGPGDAGLSGQRHRSDFQDAAGDEEVGQWLQENFTTKKVKKQPPPGYSIPTAALAAPGILTPSASATDLVPTGISSPLPFGLGTRDLSHLSPHTGSLQNHGEGTGSGRGSLRSLRSPALSESCTSVEATTTTLASGGGLALKTSPPYTVTLVSKATGAAAQDEIRATLATKFAVSSGDTVPPTPDQIRFTTSTGDSVSFVIREQDSNTASAITDMDKAAAGDTTVSASLGFASVAGLALRQNPAEDTAPTGDTRTTGNNLDDEMTALGDQETPSIPARPPPPSTMILSPPAPVPVVLHDDAGTDVVPEFGPRRASLVVGDAGDDDEESSPLGNKEKENRSGSISGDGDTNKAKYNRTLSKKAQSMKLSQLQRMLQRYKIPELDVDSPDFDIFQATEEHGEKNIFVIVCCNVLFRYQLVENLELDIEVLVSFLEAIQSAYRPENPYHNSIHAADVLQTTHVYLCVGDVKDNFEDAELLSVLFSALVHDVGHLGISNAFLIKTMHPLAALYNDSSPLESMHASLSFCILAEHNFFAKSTVWDDKMSSAFRSRVVEIVIGTDMKFHANLINTVADILADGQIDDDEVTYLFKSIVHAADLSNPMKPAHIYKNWLHRVTAEAWMQGKEETKRGLPMSVMCDRSIAQIPKQQAGFVNFIVRPFIQELASLLPKVWVDRLESNCTMMSTWEGPYAGLKDIEKLASRGWTDTWEENKVRQNHPMQHVVGAAAVTAGNRRGGGAHSLQLSKLAKAEMNLVSDLQTMVIGHGNRAVKHVTLAATSSGGSGGVISLSVLSGARSGPNLDDAGYLETSGSNQASRKSSCVSTASSAAAVLQLPGPDGAAPPLNYLAESPVNNTNADTNAAAAGGNEASVQEAAEAPAKESRISATGQDFPAVGGDSKPPALSSTVAENHALDVADCRFALALWERVVSADIADPGLGIAEQFPQVFLKRRNSGSSQEALGTSQNQNTSPSPSSASGSPDGSFLGHRVKFVRNRRNSLLRGKSVMTQSMAGAPMSAVFKDTIFGNLLIKDEQLRVAQAVMDDVLHHQGGLGANDGSLTPASPTHGSLSNSASQAMQIMSSSMSLLNIYAGGSLEAQSTGGGCNSPTASAVFPGDIVPSVTIRSLIVNTIKLWRGVHSALQSSIYNSAQAVATATAALVVSPSTNTVTDLPCAEDEDTSPRGYGASHTLAGAAASNAAASRQVTVLCPKRTDPSDVDLNDPDSPARKHTYQPYQSGAGDAPTTSAAVTTAAVGTSLLPLPFNSPPSDQISGDASQSMDSHASTLTMPPPPGSTRDPNSPLVAPSTEHPKPTFSDVSPHSLSVDALHQKEQHPLTVTHRDSVSSTKSQDESPVHRENTVIMMGADRTADRLGTPGASEEGEGTATPKNSATILNPGPQEYRSVMEATAPPTESEDGSSVRSGDAHPGGTLEVLHSNPAVQNHSNTYQQAIDDLNKTDQANRKLEGYREVREGTEQGARAHSRHNDQDAHRSVSAMDTYETVKPITSGHDDDDMFPSSDRQAAATPNGTRSKPKRPTERRSRGRGGGGAPGRIATLVNNHREDDSDDDDDFIDNGPGGSGRERFSNPNNNYSSSSHQPSSYQNGSGAPSYPEFQGYQPQQQHYQPTGLPSLRGFTPLAGSVRRGQNNPYLAQQQREQHEKRLMSNELRSGTPGIPQPGPAGAAAGGGGQTPPTMTHQHHPGGVVFDESSSPLEKNINPTGAIYRGGTPLSGATRQRNPYTTGGDLPSGGVVATSGEGGAGQSGLLKLVFAPYSIPRRKLDGGW